MRRTPGFAETLPGFVGPTRTTLLILFGLFLAQLVLGTWMNLPVVDLLAWWPLHSDAFRPWQPLTHALLAPADPIGALFSWLLIYFLLPACATTHGWRALWRGLAFVMAASIGVGVLLQWLGAVLPQGVYVGLAPALTALTVIFGLSNPNATLLLFFILPVRAAWVAWGAGLLSLLAFLSTRSMEPAMALAGWCAAWLWMRELSLRDLRRPYLRWKQARIHRRLRQLQVIEGGRGRQPPSDDDGPLYH